MTEQPDFYSLLLSEAHSDLLPYHHKPNTHWDNLARQGFTYDVLKASAALGGSTLSELLRRELPHLATSEDEATHKLLQHTHFKVVSKLALPDVYRILDNQTTQAPLHSNYQQDDKDTTDFITSPGIVLPNTLTPDSPYSNQRGDTGHEESVHPAPTCSTTERIKTGLETFLELHGTAFVYPLRVYSEGVGLGYRASSGGETGATWVRQNVVYTCQRSILSERHYYGRCVILSEGVADAEAMSLFYPHCMATLTARCSDQQAWLISMLTNRVVLCMDNDEAGRKGTWASKRNLEKYGVYVGELRLSSKVKDPGDLLKPGNFQAILSGQSEIALDLVSQLMGLGVL